MKNSKDLRVQRKININVEKSWKVLNLLHDRNTNQ